MTRLTASDVLRAVDPFGGFLLVGCEEALLADLRGQGLAADAVRSQSEASFPPGKPPKTIIIGADWDAPKLEAFTSALQRDLVNVMLDLPAGNVPIEKAEAILVAQGFERHPRWLRFSQGGGRSGRGLYRRRRDETAKPGDNALFVTESAKLIELGYDLASNLIRPNDRVLLAGRAHPGRETVVAFNAAPAAIVDAGTALRAAEAFDVVIANLGNTADLEALATLVTEGRLTPGGRALAIFEPSAQTTQEELADRLTEMKLRLDLRFICRRTGNVFNAAPWSPTDAEGEHLLVISLIRDPLIATSMAQASDAALPQVVDFARHYNFAGVVRAISDRSTRFQDRAALLETSRNIVEHGAPRSPERGAALCTLAYLLLDAGDEDTLLKHLAEVADYVATASPENPHVLRWVISLNYIAALAFFRLGRPEDGRRFARDCAQTDPNRFSPLLATKSVLAAWLLANDALSQAATDEARHWLMRCIDMAKHAATGDWRDIVGDTETPLPFGLPELGDVMRFASRAAEMLSHWPPGESQGAVAWERMAALGVIDGAANDVGAGGDDVAAHEQATAAYALAASAKDQAVSAYAQLSVARLETLQEERRLRAELQDVLTMARAEADRRILAAENELRAAKDQATAAFAELAADRLAKAQELTHQRREFETQTVAIRGEADARILGAEAELRAAKDQATSAYALAASAKDQAASAFAELAALRQVTAETAAHQRREADAEIAAIRAEADARILAAEAEVRAAKDQATTAYAMAAAAKDQSTSAYAMAALAREEASRSS